MRFAMRPAPPGSHAQWELVAGERRWRAVTRLGWREVPAILREVDDRTLLVLARVQNLQHSARSAFAEAECDTRPAEGPIWSQPRSAGALAGAVSLFTVV